MDHAEQIASLLANLPEGHPAREPLEAARRIGRGATVVLPPARYEHLSRGKGWARKGRGESAVWGERAEGGGYVVGPGTWTLGSSDGFRREDRQEWRVKTIEIAGETWTVAIRG